MTFLCKNIANPPCRIDAPGLLRVVVKQRIRSRLTDKGLGSRDAERELHERFRSQLLLELFHEPRIAHPYCSAHAEWQRAYRPYLSEARR